jgi:hypothetical protein
LASSAAADLYKLGGLIVGTSKYRIAKQGNGNGNQPTNRSLVLFVKWV